ncbi:uncharacterized protein SCHCODRAFT_02285676 [Schizophyllum commune H4-8]|uniref:uncharacterized protein n=1 Tax=Schizophyllum commune (strain H4-8 / FGSC 9210) TaxID=578458 RepID=UPI00215EF9E3|nr:uncharacterized protein SCHCODRAFT_02285676 [Schizophyllum commune H4-8]KAI5892185.1 hypothetical protein SCHCODRAFT_02285676 [Schizophyllum commune H4-8]
MCTRSLSGRRRQLRDASETSVPRSTGATERAPSPLPTRKGRECHRQRTSEAADEYVAPPLPPDLIRRREDSIIGTTTRPRRRHRPTRRVHCRDLVMPPTLQRHRLSNVHDGPNNGRSRSLWLRCQPDSVHRDRSGDPPTKRIRLVKRLSP